MSSLQKGLVMLCLYLIYINFNLNEGFTVYCMQEGSDIPDIAETKSDVQPQQTRLGELVGKNLDTYISDKNLIAEQQEEIKQLTKELEFRTDVFNEVAECGAFESTLREMTYYRNGIEEYRDSFIEELIALCKEYNKDFSDIHPELAILDNEAVPPILDSDYDSDTKN